MDLKHIHGQMELMKKSISEMNTGNRIFENLLNEAVKGAPEEDKKIVEGLKIQAFKAIRLCKEGKAEEAQKIIKDLQNYGR